MTQTSATAINRDYSILIRNHLVSLPTSRGDQAVSQEYLATLLSNVAYYGYAMTHSGCTVLSTCDEPTLTAWWQKVEPVLKSLTGDDKQMGDFVVYKNFPAEVLKMSEAEYWMKQIGMYWGLPNEWFTEPPEKRPELDEVRRFRTLQPARDDSLANILNSLLGLPNRWTEAQLDDAIHLAAQLNSKIDSEIVPFKENLVLLVRQLWVQGKDVDITSRSATDVLRLATGMSDGDLQKLGTTKFRTFSRPERRRLLRLLEDTGNLEEDLTRYPQVWKKLFRALRPGDYKASFPKSVTAYDKLYNNRLPQTFNGKLEQLLKDRDHNALSLLKTRPGEFARRLHTCVLLFGQAAVDAAIEVIPRLTTVQLLKLQAYWETVGQRSFRTIAPRGNWTALQVLPNDPKRRIDKELRDQLLDSIANQIRQRIDEKVGPVNLDQQTAGVKLQTNDSDLTPYGRGTVFPIPDNINFIRTASYWSTGPSSHNLWFDNGWNFFGDHWKPFGACCWTHTAFEGKSAVFSGDPTNSKDVQGRACQLIDLYLDRLSQLGVRYALWNILCYSNVSFESADEVFAALQWGEKPQEGKLFEPSRCQLSFELNGPGLTKYIAYIDLEQRQVVYIDANLRGNVGSAAANGERMSKTMPAFVEYLGTLPSVYDLFKHQDSDATGVPIMYTDRDVELNSPQAYVFRPESEVNEYEQLDLSSIIGT